MPGALEESDKEGELDLNPVHMTHIQHSHVRIVLHKQLLKVSSMYGSVACTASNVACMSALMLHKQLSFDCQFGLDCAKSLTLTSTWEQCYQKKVHKFMNWSARLTWDSCSYSPCMCWLKTVSFAASAHNTATLKAPCEWIVDNFVPDTPCHKHTIQQDWAKTADNSHLQAWNKVACGNLHPRLHHNWCCRTYH